MLLQKYFPILLFIIAGTFGGSPAFSQVIYVTKYNDADVMVFITEYKSEADLVVYKTTYKSDADGDDGIWYFTDHKSEADRVVRFIKSRHGADVVIYYTSFKNDAGWVHKNKKGKL